jgi:MFS family permease
LSLPDSFHWPISVSDFCCCVPTAWVFVVKDIVLLYALFNIAFVVAAPLIGKLGDRIGRARMIMLSYRAYLLMCVGFTFATIQWQVIVLFIVYGVFYAIDEAQSKAFIADTESDHRASAIGLYNFVTGLIYLPASLIAGALWLAQGPLQMAITRRDGQLRVNQYRPSAIRSIADTHSYLETKMLKDTYLDEIYNSQINQHQHH